MGVRGVKLAAGTGAREDTAGHDDVVSGFDPQFRAELKLLEVPGNLRQDVLEHVLLQVSSTNFVLADGQSVPAYDANRRSPTSRR